MGDKIDLSKLVNFILQDWVLYKVYFEIGSESFSRVCSSKIMEPMCKIFLKAILRHIKKECSKDI